jgi:hypothetical protein
MKHLALQPSLYRVTDGPGASYKFPTFLGTIISDVSCEAMIHGIISCPIALLPSSTWLFSVVNHSGKI